MDFLTSIKEISIWSNTAYDYLLAFCIFIGLMIILKIFQVIILARLNAIAKKTKTDFDDVLIEIFKKIKPPFYFFIALYFAIKSLQVNEIVSKSILVLFLIVIVFEVIQGISRLVDYFVKKYTDKAENGESDKAYSESMIKLLQLVVKISLWVIGIILILSNMGIDVTSLIAGLGIGGIAIALALQTVLGDLFSAFAIYIDKPFKIGDFIIVGADMGTVEKIGLKTTRLKTLQGEQLIIANQELTKARIQNFRRMQERRVVVTLGVTYDTDHKKLSKIPDYIKEIINNTEGARLDRCHFSEYADSSLIYEIVFFVDSPDYNYYMDVRQKINLDINAKFAKEKIEFAYPTQTVYLQK